MERQYRRVEINHPEEGFLTPWKAVYRSMIPARRQGMEW
jgi:hypothetical protein